MSPVTQTSLSEIKLRVPSNHLMLELLGERDAFLRRVESEFPEARIVARGNELDIVGLDSDAELVNPTGQRLLGYGVDEQFRLQKSELVPKDVHPAATHGTVQAPLLIQNRS